MIFSHPPKKPTKTGKKATVGGPTASWYFPRDMKAVVGRGVKSRVSLRYIQKFNRMTRRSVSLHQAQNAAGTSKEKMAKHINIIYHHYIIIRKYSGTGAPMAECEGREECCVSLSRIRLSKHLKISPICNYLLRQCHNHCNVGEHISISLYMMRTEK